jgi:hypothetical protein
MPDLVQERDLIVAEAILNRYNKDLHCPQCQTKYTSDMTTFTRDQAGRKGDMFYRKYRCKGKQKQRCNANLSVQELIRVAMKDLGPATVAGLRAELGIPETPKSPKPPRRRFQVVPLSVIPPQPPTPVAVLQTPVGKRRRDSTIHTHLTPEAKRVNSMQSPSLSHSTVIPETQEGIVESPPTAGQSSTLARLQSELRHAHERIATLEKQLAARSQSASGNSQLYTADF